MGNWGDTGVVTGMNYDRYLDGEEVWVWEA